MSPSQENSSTDKKILCSAILVFVFDRLSKELSIKYGNPTINTGTVFGLFRDNNLLFIIVSVIILAMVLVHRRQLATRKSSGIFLGIIAGGALGNIYDRIILGHVIDFISLKIWPAFNIADASITLGIIGLLWQNYRKK